MLVWQPARGAARGGDASVPGQEGEQRRSDDEDGVEAELAKAVPVVESLVSSEVLTRLGHVAILRGKMPPLTRAAAERAAALVRARDLHERLGDNQEADDLVELILRTCSLDDICSVKAVSTRFTNVGRRIVHSKMWRTNNVFSLAPKIWADGPYSTRRLLRDEQSDETPDLHITSLGEDRIAYMTTAIS